VAVRSQSAAESGDQWIVFGAGECGRGGVERESLRGDGRLPVGGHRHGDGEASLGGAGLRAVANGDYWSAPCGKRENLDGFQRLG